MASEENYISELANFLLELTTLNVMDEDYIKKVMDVVTKCFNADYCVWHRSKRKIDHLDFKKLGLENNLQRVRVILLNSKYGNETFLLVNPKIDYKLEEFLIEKLRDVLGNVSSSEFSISDLKNEMATDALTGVSNVDAFQKMLESKKEFKNVGVCFVDVNGLGIINNLYGHEAGDKLLIGIAELLKKYVRKTDVYRKGGDEFVIVCENLSEETFFAKIEAIRMELSSSGYSASLGAVYKNETNDLNGLVVKADELMYIEKENYRLANPDKYKITR